jgi:gas vesicle protein
MSKLSKNTKIAIGAGVFAAVGGLAYLLLNPSTGSNTYTDEQLLVVARELKKELFPAWHLAFDMARKLKMMIAAQTRQDPNRLAPQHQQLIFQKAVAESKFPILEQFLTCSRPSLR